MAFIKLCVEDRGALNAYDESVSVKDAMLDAATAISFERFVS